MKIYIFTTYDAWRHLDWPKELLVKPSVGEFIRNIGGNIDAKISKIIHVKYKGEQYLELYITTEDGKIPTS